MRAHRRLGIAVAVNLLVFVLLVVTGSLMKSSAVSSPIEAFFPNASVAEARIITRVISPAIVPAAQLRDNQVKVTGIIQCTAGQTLRVGVTVKQGSTEGTGEAQYTCTGHTQRWVVYVTAEGGAEFESGTAAVDAWAETIEDGDRREWHSSVRLAGKH